VKYLLTPSELTINNAPRIMKFGES
jgi:hypothetical protein